MKTFKQHLNEEGPKNSWAQALNPFHYTNFLPEPETGNEDRPDPRIIQSQSFAPSNAPATWQVDNILGPLFGVADNVYERKFVSNLVREYGNYLDDPPSDLDGVIAIALEKADEFAGFGGHSRLLKTANGIIDELDVMEEELISEWRKGNYNDWATSLRLNALERFRQRIRSGIIDVLQPEEL